MPGQTSGFRDFRSGLRLFHEYILIKNSSSKSPKNICRVYLSTEDINLKSIKLLICSALKDHEKSDLDPDEDHLPKSDLRSRSDSDLT